MVCGAKSSLNMDALDHSDDEEEEQSRYATSRFGKRRAKRRSVSHQPLLLLMDCVGGSDNGDAEEETVPLPDYERLSQSERLTDDPVDAKDPVPTPLTPAQQQQTPEKREAPSPPQPPPPPPPQQQKPAAWRLLEYVRSRHKAGGGGAAGGCGAASSDGDSKSSEDGEKEGKDGSEEGKKDKKKKRSSWLPDPDRRWPVQGFY